ncbi:unnamed protein product, partial [Rotaria sp. Silwood1]
LIIIVTILFIVILCIASILIFLFIKKKQQQRRRQQEHIPNETKTNMTDIYIHADDNNDQDLIHMSILEQAVTTV